ncbi:hypothetical protein G7076_07730 [Sphingomonas sp. HDW15A]|uniref:hypothetical protein n=1 Tax=Sphingomonas sp. HDW15A TaxID=2714942 RepID=UPI001409B4A4|nr:hypothetical protein [Sphingomonas sp. HDW15A]QIK96349.1 hypothetical protein G7076_07730 [Sphingomonas sp. HDW15A]
MFDPYGWFQECERTFADAEYLAIRLARVASTPGSELTELRLGISPLRAEFEQARTEMGYDLKKALAGEQPVNSLSQ